MKRLIRHLLSVARVGASQRQALRVALAGNDEATLRALGRKLVTTLMGRGDLVRVLIDDRNVGESRLYALRGHSSLLDLTPLYARTVTPLEPARAAPPSLPAPGSAGYDQHERVLNAMERAQDLNIARAGNDGLAGLLQDVIDLVRPTFEDVSLHIELFDDGDIQEPQPNVTLCPRTDRPFWAVIRKPGDAVWIERRCDLPPALRETGSMDEALGCVSVPLLAPEGNRDRGEDVSGEVGLLYVMPRHETGRETLIRLAFRISQFVTNGWRLTEHVNRLVHIDPLTGVHNRAFYEEQFALEVERAQRRGSGLVLLLGDIDHFKSVNDRYGHPAGDRVLRAVAREMLEGLRRIDLVCRVGGEEFALILPDTEIEAARDVITRLQVRIANLHITDPDAAEPIRVTVSFGGVGFPGAGDTPDELYRNADRMLYLSKQRGRNRCHFWNPSGDPILTLPRYAPTD